MSAARAFSTAAQERQAQDIAASRLAVPPAGRRSLRTEETPGITGAGRPLPLHERTRMEQRFGRDFSGVRVHAESKAPEEMGAKAFAYGGNIVFGPGEYAPQTLPGNDLLTHELTHVAQQADRGAPAIQKQPKNGKDSGGIGSVAPSEPFEKATEIGPEDGSVLFDLDKATLTPDSRNALVKAVGMRKAPVTVRLEGYASSEGQGPDLAEYNRNLSAYRVLAVKEFLLGRLPAGSKVVPLAYGETAAFGPVEQNRRVGFIIRDGVDAPVEAQKKAEDSVRKDTATVSPFPPIDLHPKVDLGSLAPRAPYRLIPAGPYLTPPFGKTPTYGDIDWDGLHSKAMDHGLRIDDALANSLAAQFTYGYNFFLPFLGPDLALSASNFATNYAFSNFLEAENPNAVDRFNLEFKHAYPNEKSLVIPFLSSDILDSIRKKWKGNEKDDYYFRFNWP
jgi:outer membrane protein OmpA-like peptidoglycan-associated protein